MKNVLEENFGSGPEGPELEGEQADRKFKAENLEPDVNLFCVWFSIEECMPLLRLLNAPSKKTPVLFWRDRGVPQGRP
jgi:hypothetical protein